MALTPMMKQYQQAKAACPDAVLLFRMGDFYELFYEDAHTAARVLNLTLTSRDKGENPVPMAGFPHHQLENYLGKLVAAGYRVAICDQVEDPRQAKGLVRREVTRIVTRGTLTEEALLDPRESNFLAAVALPPQEPRGKGEPARAGLAWVDLSTGQFFAAVVAPEELWDELARVQPVECLLPEGTTLPEALARQGVVQTTRPPWHWEPRTAEQALLEHFGTQSLEGFGFDAREDQVAILAAGVVLQYLKETQKGSLEHLDRLLPFRTTRWLLLDEFTRRSLELSRTMRSGSRHGSLLWVLDQTVTAPGSRELAQWVAHPLTDVEHIRRRQQAVAALVEDQALREALRAELKRLYDLPRLLARIATGRATPRDLKAVGDSLAIFPQVQKLLAPREERLLQHLAGQIDPCQELCRRLQQALVDDPPLAIQEGGIIRPGYHQRLDHLRQLAQGGREWIARYQAEQIRRTGIPSLKVGFNQVFGYYLEVTNAHRDKVPEDYIRKQTLKNAERYITPELKEYEQKVLQADEQARQLEQELFLELRQQVARQAASLRRSAEALARLDVLAALAHLAVRRGYVRPEVVQEPVLHITAGRHPVLDVTEPEGTFVPNDVHCDQQQRILLITGPNMAGKSTYIRQVALLVIMAQLGSFIPAQEATVGVADRIFARVGASDDLAGGRSTFMVEMTETARILNTATARSLVILDEIGRGTSTYDGLSLAWSVVEYIHRRIDCRTLFATHYHELTELAQHLPRVKNFNVAVREWNDQVVFLHQIVPGAADKSYGIHVARLAGVPEEVIQRARTILAQLEEEHHRGAEHLRALAVEVNSVPRQLWLFEPPHQGVIQRLRSVDVERTSPLEALQLLQELQEQLKREN